MSRKMYIFSPLSSIDVYIPHSKENEASSLSNSEMYPAPAVAF